MLGWYLFAHVCYQLRVHNIMDSWSMLCIDDYSYIARCISYSFLDGNNNTLAMQSLTKNDVETLKKECNNFHELLLPANEVEFTDIIGEGIFIFVCHIVN